MCGWVGLLDAGVAAKAREDALPTGRPHATRSVRLPELSVERLFAACFTPTRGGESNRGVSGENCRTVMTRMQSMDALVSGSAYACVKRELARTRMSLTCSLKDRPFRHAWVGKNAEPRPPC